MSAWTPLPFGKHIDKTLPQVLFTDPDWFFWAWQVGTLGNNYLISGQAKEVHRRGSAIRIPARFGEDTKVEYAREPNGRFAGMSIVPTSAADDGGSSIFARAIDFGLPSRLKSYDKAGYRIFLRDLKSILFQNENTRITKQRAEAFFENDEWFWL